MRVLGGKHEAKSADGDGRFGSGQHAQSVGTIGVSGVRETFLAAIASEAAGVKRTTEVEADLVSQRIVEVLTRSAYAFAPLVLSDIYRQPFQDLDPNNYHPGEDKREPLAKSDLVLNGDSVLYVDPSMIECSLDFAFAAEVDYTYAADFDDAQIDHFSRFVARHA